MGMKKKRINRMNSKHRIQILHRAFAEAIVKRPLRSHQDIEQAAIELRALSAAPVLIVGITAEDLGIAPSHHGLAYDYWANEGEAFWLSFPNYTHAKDLVAYESLYTHAIQAFLDLDYSMYDAVVLAKMVLLSNLRQGNAIDKNNVAALIPENELDMPYVTLEPLITRPKPFKRFQPGLYPIVESSHWVKLLCEAGVRCIQLRIKNASYSQLVEEIRLSVFLAKQHKVTLFINDYWQEAIQYGADGVHLGQEDLPSADIEAIFAKGLYLGISTYCYFEAARAHAYNPSYIACGPIYPTNSKILPFKAQGLIQLARWRRTLTYPLVAIGGISLERYPKVLQTGVRGISLISAITKAHDPIKATQHLLDLHT